MEHACRANALPMPNADQPTGAWLRETLQHMVGYRPCGKPATHWGYGGRKPLCTEHAGALRAALRDPTTLGNVLAGRARTEEEIAKMVTPIQPVENVQ